MKRIYETAKRMSQKRRGILLLRGPFYKPNTRGAAVIRRGPVKAVHDAAIGGASCQALVTAAKEPLPLAAPLFSPVFRAVQEGAPAGAALVHEDSNATAAVRGGSKDGRGHPTISQGVRVNPTSSEPTQPVLAARGPAKEGVGRRSVSVDPPHLTKVQDRFHGYSDYEDGADRLSLDGGGKNKRQEAGLPVQNRLGDDRQGRPTED